MGITVIVPDVNWSQKNLGQVTLQGNVPIQAIAVTGASSIVGTGKYSAKLFPATTTHRSVVWSIVSGGSYATITQEGMVTALAGASSDLVTIRATSSDDSSIYGDKTISVTAGTVVYYDYMQSDGAVRFLLNGGYSFGQDFPAHKLIVRCTYTTSNGYVFGGQYQNNTGAAKSGTYKRNAGDIGVALGASDYVSTGVNPVAGKVYRLEFTYSSGESVADGSVVIYDDSENTQVYSKSNVRMYLNSDISLFVYGRNQAGAGTTFTVEQGTYSANKLYGLEVYDSSDNKIMHIKAATLEGTPILMDTVTSQIYYNLGEGTPTPGND